MTAFEAYTKYLAIKAHFTSDYDYVRYNGKIKASATAFEGRRDKYMFHKLSKRENVEDYLVANLSDKPTMWVGDLFEPSAQQKFNDYVKRRQSLSYMFRNEIDLLLDDFDANFKVTDGDYPPLLKLHVRGSVSIETLIVLNDIVNFFPHWNKYIADPVQWPKIANKAIKMKSFLSYDKAKYTAMLKQRFC